MPTFTDNLSREWQVKLEAHTIRQIRNACGVDPISEDGFSKLFEDDVLLVEVMTLICEAQRQESGIKPESFAQNLIGDALDRARDALQAAVLEFCPGQKRETLRANFANMQRIRKEAYSRWLEKVGNPEYEANLLTAIQTWIDSSAGAVLTSLAST
jgi:hypothetical protein